MFPEYEDVIINEPDMRTIFDVLAANTADYDFVYVVAGAGRHVVAGPHSVPVGITHTGCGRAGGRRAGGRAVRVQL